MVKASKYYKPNETRNYLLKQWENINVSSYKMETLYYWARRDNIEMFNKIMLDNIILEPAKERDDIIKIENRYLLDVVKGLEDKKSILAKNINNFFTTDTYKSLNIKSPYDTGKTQLIKKIIEKYEPKRILWISYRKTLTYDINGNFENFGFKSYLDGDIFSDRVIIQIESLIKLNINAKIPKFDLIIIDEVESILNQFSSSGTFKNKERETFNYFDMIIKNSILNNGKIISLDGDLDERTYNFIERYGKPLNINNTVNFNTKKINIINDREIYNNLIFEALDANKKIIMPVMSESEAIFWELEIKSRYPPLAVQKYTSKTSDTDKDKLKDILKEWSTLDVIIYTPTIEAGVSFDLERFDVIFGIISDNVASQRSYFQMLARVRKIKQNDIYLLNINGCKINACKLETMQEYKEAQQQLLNIVLERNYELVDNNYIQVVQNNAFDDLFCYNKIEEINKQKYIFMLIFKKIALKKGFQFEIIEKVKGAKKCILKADASLKRQYILEADDISYSTMEILLEKQKNGCITTDEIYKLNKWHLKNKLGVNELDDEIIKMYDGNNKLEKFLSLLSVQNINEDVDINKRVVYEQKAHIITKFLKKVGFEKIISDVKITSEKLEKNIKELIEQNDELFDDKNKLLFTSRNKKLTTFKGSLGFINTILEGYSLKILMSSRERCIGIANPLNYYSLEPLNGVNELIKLAYYKKFSDPDYNLIDNEGENIVSNYPRWEHLIYSKEQKTKNEDIFIDSD